MRRAVEDRIKALISASEDLEAIIARYMKEKGENASEILIADMERVKGSYVQAVFEAAREGGSSDVSKSGG